MCVFLTAFISAALFFSLLHGLKPHKIFFSKEGRDAFESAPISLKIHQFWLNFIGSILGWAGFYFVIREVILGFASNDISFITWRLFGLVIFSFIGITGFMPLVVNKMYDRFGDMLSTVLGK